MFPGFRLQNIAGTGSDHLAIMVHLLFKGFVRRRKRNFKFEAMWLQHPDVAEIVENGWKVSGQGNELSKTIQCIKNCGNHLSVWNREHFGIVQRDIQNTRAMIERMQAGELGDCEFEQCAILEKSLESLLEREEIAWKQRSRVDWLKGGDRNTRFFHFKASQ